MKASDLKKISRTAKEIFDNIQSNNKANPSICKHFIPHFDYVSPEVQLELIAMGFKLSHGKGFANEDCLVIEW
ncbi:hypothetical protein [Flavobacterium sp. UMI-01]|uniref:hypothetical protein n=1 Tax=Flavobacterium sp. UMI-01 TaxID=1441053 RepID=UPI001C7D5F9B|nr:hypothetical protein [Flavobacterium sp. UMI-01]GIZ08368.1 hypothetical protein FUMI01_10950 [Flavobacterium sp. UMI-01]